MRHSRRAVLAALATFSLGAQAQARYPSKPVRIVLPFSAGTSGDTIMRAIAQRLTENHGHAFVVENRDGGLGIPATQNLLGAEPDGYTLFWTQQA